MSVSLKKNGERIIPEHFLQSKEAYLVYLRHLFAYKTVTQFLPKQSSVLEVGCGEGYGTSMLSQEVQAMIGVDVDPNVIEYASRKYGSQNCAFRLSDGSTLPFDKNTFDAVISFQVIEHVKDDTHFLAEIHRVVKAGGVCIMTTPNKSYRVRSHKKPWNRFHIREYTAKEFEDLLKKVFPEFHVWGIQGNDDIQKIETARIKQIQKFVDIDLLNLRKLLPASYETRFVTWLKQFLKRKHASGTQNTYMKTYRVEDYFLVKDDIEKSLDLLAICRKEQ